MEGKQTAVEWFFDRLENHEIQAKHYDLYQQAKAIEKEQIVNAYRKGVINAEEHPEGEIINWEPYYNETYGK